MPTFTAYLIGPLVHRFHSAHPGITLSIREDTQDRIEADLLADRLDLGIAFAGPHAAGIDHTALFTETLTLVVGSGHSFAGRTTPLPVARLAREPLCLLSTEFATRLQIDAYFTDRGVAPRITVEANSISALLASVRGGTLTTVLPDAITREHHRGVHAVPLVPPLPTRTAVVLVRATAYHSAAAQAFTRMLEEIAHEID